MSGRGTPGGFWDRLDEKRRQESRAMPVPDHADEQDAHEDLSPREHAMYLRTWLRSHWGEFGPAFETALCNAIAALEATEP